MLLFFAMLGDVWIHRLLRWWDKNKKEAKLDWEEERWELKSTSTIWKRLRGNLKGKSAWKLFSRRFSLNYKTRKNMKKHGKRLQKWRKILWKLWKNRREKLCKQNLNVKEREMLWKFERSWEKLNENCSSVFFMFSITFHKFYDEFFKLNVVKFSWMISSRTSQVFPNIFSMQLRSEHFLLTSTKRF